MNGIVARNTCGSNIKPVFRGIPQMMVVLFCFFSKAIPTNVCTRLGQYSTIYKIRDFMMGFSFVWVEITVFYIPCMTDLLPYFCLSIVFLPCFSFYGTTSLSCPKSSHLFLPPGLSIETYAYFTSIFNTIFFIFAFMKFRNGFNFFARRTSFCYNLLRHSFLQYRKSCLEPTMSYTLIIGLSYFIANNSFVKEII